ncbi:hypothetical protein [Methylobacterium sp. Leaf456]|uniref:hypothetical protein n=1 Tax=Methylobacterium sp. Leaf456 TaxID=1736382 RepID=UPI000A671787|nr:hypothetical protein [Methylobacterium sp. Leaf456]
MTTRVQMEAINGEGVTRLQPETINGEGPGIPGGVRSPMSSLPPIPKVVVVRL